MVFRVLLLHHPGIEAGARDRTWVSTLEWCTPHRHSGTVKPVKEQAATNLVKTLLPCSPNSIRCFGCEVPELNGVVQLMRLVR